MKSYVVKAVSNQNDILCPPSSKLKVEKDYRVALQDEHQHTWRACSFIDRIKLSFMSSVREFV